MARDLGVSVLIISQLDRESGHINRRDKQPILSDLSDWETVEKYSDTVLFLHRDDYYTLDYEDEEIAEVIVAKQRSGHASTVRLSWQADCCLFRDLPYRPALGT